MRPEVQGDNRGWRCESHDFLNPTHVTFITSKLKVNSQSRFRFASPETRVNHCSTGVVALLWIGVGPPKIADSVFLGRGVPGLIPARSRASCRQSELA